VALVVATGWRVEVMVVVVMVVLMTNRDSSARVIKKETLNHDVATKS
jgi:hypothetical protein